MLRNLTFMCVVMSFLMVAPVSAQQGMAEKLSDVLTDTASEQFNAELTMDSLIVSGLTDELSAEGVSISTRVDQLSEPLNRIIMADSLRLSGNWQDLGQRKVRINRLILSGAQLTVAYYGAGQSNLHELLDALKDLAQPKMTQVAMSKNVDWAVEQMTFDDVTINLFDKGEPIASVHVPRLELNEINHTASTDTQVKALVFPVIDQLVTQWRKDKNAIQLNVVGLSRFIMREAIAYKL